MQVDHFFCQQPYISQVNLPVNYQKGENLRKCTNKPLFYDIITDKSLLCCCMLSNMHCLPILPHSHKSVVVYLDYR